MTEKMGKNISIIESNREQLCNVLVVATVEAYRSTANEDGKSYDFEYIVQSAIESNNITKKLLLESDLMVLTDNKELFHISNDWMSIYHYLPSDTLVVRPTGVVEEMLYRLKGKRHG